MEDKSPKDVTGKTFDYTDLFLVVILSSRAGMRCAVIIYVL